MSKKHKAKLALSKMGDKNPHWGGGRIKTVRGYIKVKCKGHPRADLHDYVYEHILVMEKHLERYLVLGEEVHHIDRNKLNNVIDNLMFFPTHSAHLRYEHKQGYKFSGYSRLVNSD